MVPNPVQPMCFVAMPFGKKAPPGRKKPRIDFNAIFEVIKGAVEGAGLECVRADYEPGGGFIHKPMFERLLLAEYVVADLTFANPNVTYEIGVRHGGTRGHTLLVRGANARFGDLPFDFKPFRVLMYEIEDDGSLGKKTRRKLAEGLAERLAMARRDELPLDNPILQVTSIRVPRRVEHEKTDVFQAREAYVSKREREVAEAVREPNRDRAVERLGELASELLEHRDAVFQLYTVLIRVFLGYRERKAYGEMVALHGRLPSDLARETVLLEQLALAHNRLAEADAKNGDEDGATRHRQRALAALDEIPEQDRTSETYGILGRIYKGQQEAERAAGRGDQAAGFLARAIETYERGVREDPRDYYPGVNAVTLRILRGTPEDLAHLASLVPVVRFAVERAPQPKDETERYWQTATRLELAGADRDWKALGGLVPDLLGIEAYDWMRDTTIGNLQLQRAAFADDPAAVEALDSAMTALRPR